MKSLAPFALVATLTPTAGVFAGIDVIFSEVTGHPSAVVPGARDASGAPAFAEFISFELLSVMPDGTRWTIVGRNSLGGELDTMLVMGGGTTGAVLAQEGQAIPGGSAGEVFDFFGSGPPTFDSSGQFVFAARARGGDASRAHKGMLFDGVDLAPVIQQGDPVFGLLDDPEEESGDELYGNSFGSLHLLDDGTIGVHDQTIQNIASSRRPAIFYDFDAFMQAGVTPLEDRLWEYFDANDFNTTPDGKNLLVQGDDDGPITTDEVLVFNGVVQIREGVPFGPFVPDEIFASSLHPGGDWYARGDDDFNNDFAIQTGEIKALSGDPIIEGSDERWGPQFIGLTGNTQRDWVLIGSTDRGDPATNSVIVLNGTEVLAREGDMVDLNGDGLPNDDAFIGRGNPILAAFPAEQVALTDDGVLYFIASLRNAAGEDLGSFGAGGQALLRIVLNPCPADIDGSGVVDTADLVSLLAAWGPCADCPEDVDENGTVDTADLLALLAAWGPC
jgi:hypothetical protein